ncbi:MAG: prolipoprotein diacylglyceryl transferase [Actinobacteria bacterium]|nr:MAG: prolipoprotein diacylglyceryl transferase [Actinomycetota bacterium]
MRPILFYIGSIPIRAWGVFVATGFLVGLFFAKLRAKEKGIEAALIYDLAFWLLLSGIVGARLFYVLGHTDYFFQHPTEIIYINQGGMAVFGSITLGFLVAVIFCIQHKISFFMLGDIVVPGLLIGQAIGRIGCFFNACCYGSIANVPWAVKFPELIGHRHPTQLYEAVLDFIVFGFLWILRDRFVKKGTMFLSGIAFYSAIRFLVELMRVSSGRIIWLSISSTITVASLIGLIVISLKQSGIADNS